MKEVLVASDKMVFELSLVNVPNNRGYYHLIRKVCVA